MKRTPMVFAVSILLASLPARPDSSSDQQRFREIYKELVETNTSLSAGSCTLAAERMAGRLKAAGFPDRDLHLFSALDHPKEGGLVVVYPGREPNHKAVLMLAHLDVVEAKREDWTRDPFKLVEENGNFYARGAVDDKAEGACVATMLDAGHATNALPQRARANINCRIFPGVSQETVRVKLEELVADPGVAVTMLEASGPISPPAPLTPEILARSKSSRRSSGQACRCCRSCCRVHPTADT